MQLPASWRQHPLRLAGTAGLLLFGLIALFFVWRVFFYFRLIKTGAIMDLPQFSSSLTIGDIREQGNVAPVADVVTADDPMIGNARAPVTIVEFADFQCPFSREAFHTIRAVAAAYPNDVRVILRDFPLPTIHEHAESAARAAHCAGEQDKYMTMHDKLYQNAERLSDSDLRFYASQINLDLARFDVCMRSPATAQEIAEDREDGITAGVRGTPTFFLNGVRIEGSIPYTVLRQLVEDLRSRPQE